MIGYDGSARELLSELAASGGATLFVDGLDYFGDRERAVVCDLVDEASKVAGFDLIVTPDETSAKTMPAGSRPRRSYA
jgi:hypothetical protein